MSYTSTMAPMSLLFLLATLTGVYCGSFSRNNRTATIETNGRLGLGTAVASATTYGYIVTVYVPAATTPTDTTGPYGPGIVVKPHWVLVHSSLHSTVTDVTTLRAAAGALDGATPESTATVRRVKSMVPYTAPGTVIDTLKLYKVCPAFTTVATILASTTPVLTPGTEFKYINFEPTLKDGTKKVGEDCECDTYVTDMADYTSRIVPKTFCGAETPASGATATDKVGTIAVIGTDVVGLNADVSKGELYLELSQYKAWIESTAMPEP